MPQLYELNLRDYWNIFLKRKGMILVSFLVIFASIFVYTNLQTPLYQTSVLLKIDFSLGLPAEVIFPSGIRSWEYSEEISDYAKQLVSRPILELAAQELGWITKGMSSRDINQLISKIDSQISASELSEGGRRRESHLIRLHIKGPDPQRIADLGNKISEVFKKENAKHKNQSVRNVRLFIEKTLNDVSDELKKQEERLRVLTTQGAVGTGVNIVNQIYELEKKRTNLTTEFTEMHPDVQRLDEQIEELKIKLKDLPKEEFEYGILKRDIDINERLYTSLKSKLQEAQIKEAETVDNVVIVNPAISPRNPYYPNKKRNYSSGVVLGLILGVSMALITEHLDTSIGRVEDIESFVKVSVLGIVPYCTEKRRDIEKKEKKWPVALFRKTAPSSAIIKGMPIFELEQHYSSIFLEAFRILSVNVQVLFGEGGRIKSKVIIITSCNPEEGKTVVTSNLGLTMAQMGYKVLIIDADTRRSNIHKMFGLKKKENGFLDILTGKISADSAVRTATDLMLGTSSADKVMEKPWLNNLNIITSGTVFPNPINLFNSDKMNETMEYLKSKYDIILMDSSPVLAVSEPSIIIPKTDGVLLVYKAGATSRLALRRAKTQIESIKGKGTLSGVVLNNVTPEIGMDTYYYYSRKYYGEKPEKHIFEEDAKKEGGEHV